MKNKRFRKKKVIDIYPPHTLSKKEEQEKEKPASPRMEEVPVHVNRFRVEEREEYYPGEIEESRNMEEEKAVHRSSLLTYNRPSRNWLRIGGIIAIALAIYYLGFVAFVRANIFITTKKTTLPFSGVVLADRNVSEVKYSQAVIPANLFVFTESAEQNFISTGKGRDERKAKGVITIYNNYSVSPQILVATTRFETPDHKIFRLDSRVVIPGAHKVNGKLVPSSIDVKVTADKPGEAYNIPPCQLPDCKFTIPGFAGTSKFKGFYGVSSSSMKGGSSSAIPIVTSEDLKQAEDTIIQSLMKKIEADVKNKIPKDLTVKEGAKSSINITKINSDATVGDKRENFTVKGEGEVKVIAFKESDLNDYIQSRLDVQKEKEYEYYGSPAVTFQTVKPDFTKGTLKLVIQAKQQLRYYLDPKSLKLKVLGKGKSELKTIFQNVPGVEKVDVKIRPFWIRRIPSASSRVKLSID